MCSSARSSLASTMLLAIPSSYDLAADRIASVYATRIALHVAQLRVQRPRNALSSSPKRMAGSLPHNRGPPTPCDAALEAAPLFACELAA